jgi:putative ABC transport system permease protein
MTSYKVGDTIEIAIANTNDAEKANFHKVKVVGILSQSPFNAPYADNESPSIIATKITFDKLVSTVQTEEPDDTKKMGSVLLGLDVALKDGADSEPARKKLETMVSDLPNAQLIDIASQQKEARQFEIQMKIFIYGFLAVIGLIGSLNIINTVQTNLLLRRREFGLLQAVGMTMRQIRRMASTEGVWFGVIGGAWGLVFGGALSYFLYSQVSNMQGFPFEFPWKGALLAVGFALAVGLISVQGPMRRMARSNLIEALREEA